MFLRAFLAAAAFSRVSARTALLVIDVQDCFLENLTTSGEEGSLAVPASHIIAEINQMMEEKSCLFDEVIYSQDYHPPNHVSFGSTHGLAPFSHLDGKGSLPVMCVRPPSGLTNEAACCPKIYVDAASVDCTTQLCPPDTWDYDVDNPGIITGNAACTQCANEPDSCYETVQEMWTDHCLWQGDSTFPPSLEMGPDPIVVRKGINQYVDAYSAFKDNSKSVETELHAVLQGLRIDNLVVVGIATDVCVKESVRDARDYGYTVTLVQDATAAVQGNQENFDAAVEYMRQRGATISNVADILAMACPTPRPTIDPIWWMSLAGSGVLMVCLVAFCMQQSSDSGQEDVEIAQQLNK